MLTYSHSPHPCIKHTDIKSQVTFVDFPLVYFFTVLIHFYTAPRSNESTRSKTKDWIKRFSASTQVRSCYILVFRVLTPTSQKCVSTDDLLWEDNYDIYLIVYKMTVTYLHHYVSWTQDPCLAPASFSNSILLPPDRVSLACQQVNPDMVYWYNQLAQFVMAPQGASTCHDNKCNINKCIISQLVFYSTYATFHLLFENSVIFLWYWKKELFLRKQFIYFPAMIILALPKQWNRLWIYFKTQSFFQQNLNFIQVRLNSLYFPALYLGTFWGWNLINGTNY